MRTASRSTTIATGSRVDDLIDFTPELRAEGEKVVSRYKLGPIFTPPVVSKAEGPLGTLQLAINGGGTVWPGGSYDPETHILYVYSRRSPGALGLVKPDPVEERHELRPGQRAHRRAGHEPMGAAPAGRPTIAGRRPPAAEAPAAAGAGSGRRGGGEGGGARPDGSGPADREAAIRQHQRDQPEQGRDPLADRARRHAGQRPEQPGAARG